VRHLAQNAHHYCTGGHQRPLVFAVWYLKCLVPVCPGVILNRVLSSVALRTCGAGPLAHRPARPRGRSMWSFAVGRAAPQGHDERALTSLVQPEVKNTDGTSPG
jgi:hypothetical protein